MDPTKLCFDLFNFLRLVRAAVTCHFYLFNSLNIRLWASLLSKADIQEIQNHSKYRLQYKQETQKQTSCLHAD